jgi:hypothetical protein
MSFYYSNYNWTVTDIQCRQSFQVHNECIFEFEY